MIQMHGHVTRLWFMMLWLYIQALMIQAQDQTVVGTITTPYPTIVNLAVEWVIQGDDNQNGVVTVQYREKDQPSWKEGMPLFRVPAGRTLVLIGPTSTRAVFLT